MPHGSPYWLTFRQAKGLGGHVRKGEKSCPVVFWKWLEKENRDTGKTERIPLLRYYAVFNALQCELPEGKLPAVPEAALDNAFAPLERCEGVVADWLGKPDIQHDTSQACYRPATDVVHMPRPERFDGAEEYYSTLFHELTHSTGHASRLNRPGIADVARFGSRDYSKEELVAEMGAAFLCGHCAVENRTIDNSAAYVASWLARLRKDSKLVVQAAAQAQQAADWVLGTTWDAEETVKQAATAAA